MAEFSYRATEHEEQVALMDWWEPYCRTKGVDERLLFAIPNGGARHPAVAGKLKAEGVRAGAPDLMLAIPKHYFHGLFIEMKSEGGRVRPGQLEFITLLRQQGYNCAICYSMEEAMRVVMMYLSENPEEMQKNRKILG